MKIKCFTLAAVIFAAVSVGSAQQNSGIRTVDFKNFDYGTLCGGAHKFMSFDGEKLVLKKGHAEQGDEMNFTDLGSVKYADFNHDGKDEAFVVINGQTAGSSGGFRAAYIFGYEREHAKQIWSKCEEGSNAELKGLKVVFTSPDWLKTDAHCCFSYIKTDTYGWKSGKIGLISSSRKRANAEPSGSNKSVGDMAVELADAFAAGKMGALDSEKPYLSKVTVVLEHSLNGRPQTKSFTSLKRANDWLTKGRPEVNFNTAEFKRCRAGVCTFVQNGLLHNNLYLTKFTYTTTKGRSYIKTISVLDGD